jgi:hypothetical protein
MTERPILFSTPMVKAILEGWKSMTRRVVKGSGDAKACEKLLIEDCPYGQVGDRLYVKETHYRFGHWVKNGLTKTGRQKWLFKPNDKEVRFMDNPPTVNVHKLGEKDAVGWFKRSSLFLPKELSRITLEITNIRVERLQEITEEDAKAEGCYGTGRPDIQTALPLYTHTFQRLWDSINGKTYPWSSNPWVWVIEFKKV